MPGYIKTEILETNRRVSEKEFLTILQFDSKENLQAWENHPHRKEQMVWVTENLADINNGDFFENMGFWEESKEGEQKHPNRFKVYLLAVTVIFTLISTLAQYVLMPLGKFLGTPPPPAPSQPAIPIEFLPGFIFRPLFREIFRKPKVNFVSSL